MNNKQWFWKHLQTASSKYRKQQEKKNTYIWNLTELLWRTASSSTTRKQWDSVITVWKNSKKPMCQGVICSLVLLRSPLNIWGSSCSSVWNNALLLDCLQQGAITYPHCSEASLWSTHSWQVNELILLTSPSSSTCYQHADDHCPQVHRALQQRESSSMPLSTECLIWWKLL